MEHINGKIRKLNSDRPSPPQSATRYKEGTRKKGNDGNMYTVVVNKNNVKNGPK